jgi:hypothetical protein
MQKCPVAVPVTSQSLSFENSETSNTIDHSSTQLLDIFWWQSYDIIGYLTVLALI